jgi:hypothetical protein
MASRDELYDRFQDNLDRVRGLVESYDSKRIRRPGDHAVMSLSSYLVSHWITTVDKFGDDLRSAV